MKNTVLLLFEQSSLILYQICIDILFKEKSDVIRTQNFFRKERIRKNRKRNQKWLDRLFDLCPFRYRYWQLHLYFKVYWVKTIEILEQ